MSFEWSIVHLGYPGILVGTFLEGETVLILAGFAAHLGYLDLSLVMLFAFLGTLSGDQLYFFIGRRRGRAVLAKHPNWEGRVERFQSLMRKYDIAILLLFRFFYGLRTIAPFAIGLSDISVKKFIVFNIISAAIWAAAFGALGYFFGRAMEAVLTDIKHYEILIMAGLAAVAISIVIIRRVRNSKKNR
jgi:membrane protein DedA with SNARE-associated domain